MRWIVPLASLSILGVQWVPAAAQASITAFTVDSQVGDYIGAGKALAFTSADYEFTVYSPSDWQINIGVRQGGSLLWQAAVWAPRDQPLAPGTYQTTRLGDATHYKLDVSGEYRGCNTSTGVVTIHEVVADDSGVHTFAASYEQHCDEAAPALFGEIRLNSSVGYQAASAPSRLFERTSPAAGSTDSVQVTSLGSDPLQIRTASIEGEDAGNFSIGADSCSGVSLPPQSSCSIEVTRTSDDPEDSFALLRISDGTRRGSREVHLSPDAGLIPTVTKTKLLGHYGKRGKYQVFHVRNAVVQIGWVVPPDAGERLTFEVEMKRGGGWRRVASESFRIRKKGASGAVFGGRVATYRANNTFERNSTHAQSTSDWEYFKITP